MCAHVHGYRLVCHSLFFFKNAILLVIPLFFLLSVIQLHIFTVTSFLSLLRNPITSPAAIHLNILRLLAQ